jgi:uncharacterized protein YdaU (DUF1376 family)
LFYPNDFDCATRFFSDEEVGIYLRLLIAQFQNGRLSEKHMIIICKTYNKDIYSKFIRDSEGFYYNERLENELIKRKEYSESRSNNRKKKKDISKSYDEHMENENVISFNTLTNKNNVIDIKDSNSWESEKKYFKNEEVYFYKICSEYKYTKDEINLKVEEFLKSLELGEDYKSVKELKKHFYNWIKKQKKEISEKPFNPHTATGTEKAAEYERRKKEYAEQNKSNVSDFNPYNFEDN